MTTVNASSAGSASAIARLVVPVSIKMQPPGFTSFAHFCAILLFVAVFFLCARYSPRLRQGSSPAAVDLLQYPSRLSSCKSRRIVCSETLRRLASSANHPAVLLQDLANKRLSLFRKSSIIEHK